MEALCESCAGTDEDLVPVWPQSTEGDTPELWCGDCRDRYPHDPIELAEEVEEAE